MTREPISLTIADISDFARALRAQAPEGDTGHQSWLNRVARAAGYRNFQHLSALRKEAEPAADDAKVARALRYFDAEGRFARWPSRTGIQALCLWAVWARLPAGEEWSEPEVSAKIDGVTALGDAAQIRRSLAEHRLVTRDRAGSAYRRVERRPPPEARALIAALGKKSAP
jgi:hypothetical protein